MGDLGIGVGAPGNRQVTQSLAAKEQRVPNDAARRRVGRVSARVLQADVASGVNPRIAGLQEVVDSHAVGPVAVNTRGLQIEDDGLVVTIPPVVQESAFGLPALPDRCARCRRPIRWRDSPPARSSRRQRAGARRASARPSARRMETSRVRPVSRIDVTASAARGDPGAIFDVHSADRSRTSSERRSAPCATCCLAATPADRGSSTGAGRRPD